MMLRIRLMSAIESSDDRYRDKSYKICDQGQGVLTDNKNEVFTFDKIYSEHSDQKMIWKEAVDLILRTIDGDDCTILTYG